MQQSPLVSVIMPVYNSEDYLDNAISSVLAQSYDNFELLLIDDGSSDGSGQACDTWSNRDSRVRVMHKQNGGICSARNLGLKIAKGKYVAFCDNDDEYLPNLIADNVRIAEEGGKDVVRFLRMHFIIIDGKIARREILGENCKSLDINTDNICEHYYDILELGGGIWTGLYRREMLLQNGISFPEEMRFGWEDLFFNLLVLSSTCNVAINPNVYYQWSERYGHSTMRKFSTNRLDSMRMCLEKENEVNHIYSLEEDNAQQWAVHLVDTYVIRMLQQLSLPMCDLSMKDKAGQLASLADMPAISNTLQNIPARKNDIFWKTRLVAFLLRHRQFRFLITIYTLNVRREKRVY